MSLSLPATLSSAAWRTTQELRMTISAACSSDVAVTGLLQRRRDLGAIGLVHLAADCPDVELLAIGWQWSGRGRLSQWNHWSWQHMNSMSPELPCVAEWRRLKMHAGRRSARQSDSIAAQAGAIGAVFGVPPRKNPDSRPPPLGEVCV